MSKTAKRSEENPVAGSPESVVIAETLSEAGRYSYVAIIAVSLNNLFNNEWDKEFNEQCIKTIIKHLRLSDQVEQVMLALLYAEDNPEPFCYITLVVEELPAGDDPAVLVQDCVLLAVEEGVYDARWRMLMIHLCDLFGISWSIIEQYESTIMYRLLSVQPEKKEKTEEEAKKRAKRASTKRFVLMGLATIGGGALIGITGGLAAPAIVPTLSSVIGTTALLGATVGTTACTALVVSLFGAAGAGLTNYRMKRRVGEIEEFEFRYLSPVYDDKTKDIGPSQSQLHIAIAVSGWLKDDSEDNFTRPWSSLKSSQEQYYLCYESKYLLELGKAIDYFISYAASLAAHRALKYTFLSGLVAAVAWPVGLLGVASVIDNPWGVCLTRAAQVGKQLAEVLLSREHGQRPVTLVGFSLGARIIYHCLKEMSTRTGCEGIVQDAIMIGAPCAADPDEWKKMTRVVAGRLVNGYSRTDWLLRFLYRTFAIPKGGVAGLQPIELDDRRINNIDLSSVISGHGDYPEKMSLILNQILQAAGIHTCDPSTMKSDLASLDSGISSLEISHRFDSENDFVVVGDELSRNPSFLDKEF